MARKGAPVSTADHRVGLGSTGVAPRLEELVSLARSEAARGAMAIDMEAYERVDRDPMEPLIGGGSVTASVGFFGRDPGRDEVKHMEPLIGAAGQLVRAGVHRALYGCEPPDFEASQALASEVFFSTRSRTNPWETRRGRWRSSAAFVR